LKRLAGVVEEIAYPGRLTVTLRAQRVGAAQDVLGDGVWR